MRYNKNGTVRKSLIHIKRCSEMDIKKEWINPILNCVETVAVIDEETKDVLWSNVELPQGKCHEVLFGCTEQCSACPELQENESYTWDCYNKKKNQWEKVNYSLYRDADKLLRIGNFQNIHDEMSLTHDSMKEVSSLQKLLNENRRMKDKLEYEATHDRMTGLFNRNRFNMDLVSDEFGGANIGVLYFDLNNLKTINDTYRHEVGDQLICRLADTIKKAAELSEHAKCYRVGGDEFVMLVSQCTEDSLDHIRKEFREMIAEESKDQELPCIVAMGQAYSSGEMDIDALVSEADQKMYINKQNMKSGRK